MELEAAIRRRHMIRSFRPEPLPRAELDSLLDLARRAPSAGNTQATEFVVLETTQQRAAYWDTTLPEPARSRFRWASLVEAPALVLIVTSPATYVERYAEPDKAKVGLGTSREQWQVPYWFFDAGAVAQNLLLLATAKGWGACLFGPFEHEEEVCARLDIESTSRIAATVALGLPDTDAEKPGRSAHRPRRPTAEVIRRPGDL